MSDRLLVTIEVIVSGLIVAGVLWYMWRLPPGGESVRGAAPFLALGSVWLGLTALIASLALWWVAVPDNWLTVIFLVLDPAAIGTGVLVLWANRPQLGVQPVQTLAAISQQRLQAWVGIAMGLIAVAVGYAFVMTHKTVFTPVGM